MRWGQDLRRSWRHHSVNLRIKINKSRDIKRGLNLGSEPHLPQPSGPGGTRASPIGGFLFCITSNLPEERVELAADAIASMASREAMKEHVKNGFPIAPRFSVSADPEAAASSPIVRFVDQLAKKNLLQTWQRPEIPQYTSIERILEEEVHNAPFGKKSDQDALKDATRQIDLQLRAGLTHVGQIA